MPELPEVETVKETLNSRIKGAKITKVVVRYPNIIQDDVELFCQRVTGQTIMEFDRLGKYLIFKFGELNLLSHLRMEGKFFIVPHKTKYSEHELVVFELENDIDLIYHDTRRFGTMELRDNDELFTIPPLSQLGPEPFVADAAYVKKCFYGKKKTIKEMLLDQHIMAGIGNIYADEVCFLTKISPLMPAGELSDEQIELLISSAVSVLHKAIALGGTTIRSYTSSLGVTGRFQNELFVHSRDNLLCKVCSTRIVKIRVGGRGTYYCPCCQGVKK